ncbi:alpha/beta hydrolase family protein [Pseudomonas asplenii]|uniref:alpha/beta hydrolase family protein n=1 Tax=Pseudomonas asplenii TaxID=53407 RepID=UPI0022349A1F|nr:alpha/beta fold hydrolase [Pseudomonas asplenii]UZE31634.1 alpha/beta fold hydrolase [Pseudomonas asplenii]
MKTPLCVLLLLCLVRTAVAADTTIGFQESELRDTHPDRPLQMVVWYPGATTEQPVLIADNSVFVGAPAIKNAAPAGGTHPLVVISHGFGGNWGNQTWLASALAHQGYIVAAVNHPGSTSKDRSPQAAAQLWQRPVDLSRAIDAVLAEPQRFGAVDKQRIAVVGHSLGGWTAMEIAGARFDPDRFDQDCKTHSELSSCSVYQQMAPTSTPALKTRLAGDLRDKRVTAIVVLDLGLSRGLTDASLAAMKVPTLIIAAGVPSTELPAELESDDLARRLPKALVQHVKIGEASHFTFMATCKPGAEALIDEASPGESFICRDGEGARPRETLHQQISSLIVGFLAQPPR